MLVVRVVRVRVVIRMFFLEFMCGGMMVVVKEGFIGVDWC